MPYVDLNRSFAPISKEHEFSEEDFDFGWLIGDSNQFHWADLLRDKRIVILAEAGSGKTEELRAVTGGLNRQGETAFFMRLEHLCDDFEMAFDIGTAAEFEAWLVSDKIAWFFLDSVDEARMQDTNQFGRAIRRLAGKLGEHKQRAYICITSRPSEWRAKSDIALLGSQLPYFEQSEITGSQQTDDQTSLSGIESAGSLVFSGGESKVLEPKVFGLRPLNHEQQTKFSEAFGVNDSDCFVLAIEKAEADIFSDTPQDLIELIGYWNEHGKISNRAKMLKASVYSKIKEADPRRDSSLPLSFENALKGARLLSAASTFLRRNRMLIPDSNHDAAIVSNAIDAQAILKGWNAKQCRALLMRPIFDEAIYGTVRFHHRSVREYLTARWLYGLLEQGKPRRAIESLFFSERYGQEISIPSTRSILAWLLLWDERIREGAVKVCPEVLIQGGDPSSLPTIVRQELLESFCEHYARQESRHLSFDIAGVRRFSHPDLGQTINDLIARYTENNALVELLLRMIWQGEIGNCANTVHRYALDTKADLYIRIYAIRALVCVGSNQQKESFIAASIADNTLDNERIIGEIISAFAPEWLDAQGIITLLGRIKKQDRYSASMLGHHLEEFVQHQCLLDELTHWIRGVVPLLKQEPVVERRFFELSQDYRWLLPITALAAERLVREAPSDNLDRSVLEVISLVQAARSFGDVTERNSLEKLVPKCKELNRSLFWFDVELARKHLDKKKGERLTEWKQADSFHRFWLFTLDDFDSILEDVRTKEQLDNRLVALSLAFNVYRENGRGKSRRLALWGSVKGTEELESKLHTLLHPPAMTKEQRKWRRENYGWARKREKREKRDADNRKNRVVWLKEHADVLRDTSIASKGSVWDATQYLINILQDQSEDKGTWAQSNWEGLLEEFGIDVAAAFRDGCIGYWRKYIPEIRSEGMGNPNSTPNAVIVGLSGLAMEAKHVADWPKNLTEDEAHLASRYALKELNGFPDWLQRFHGVFPETFEARLLREIEWEFSEYDGEQPCYYVLSNITRIDWLPPRLSDPLLEMLRKYEPKYDQAVEDALNVVLSAPGLETTEFAELAKSKVNSNKEPSRQALWLAAWTCVEAHRAVDALASMLDKLDKDNATMLAMLYITYLLGDRHGSSLKSTYKDYMKVSILLLLIKLMHTHIHHAEDIDRSGGGVYSPGLRDNAQDARDLLFRILKEISGKETFLAMMELAQTHPNERARDWYAICARERAELDAEHPAWTFEDIASFAEEAEKTPSSHRELFDLVLSRLDDLKLDLEEGDSSNAELLRNSKEERLHRIFIGDWLRRQSRGRYSVPQEEELADRKKPDIRIDCPSLDSPIPIELKIADNNWSGSNLLERLENQLCGQYLRDVRSNCGIFLLTYCGGKRWEHPETGEMLDFSGLIQVLREKADGIAASSSMIDSIEVVGIDLTKRNKKVVREQAE